MNVLVTGGSGLLGSRVLKVLPSEWATTGTYCRHRVEGLVPCNLEDSHAAERLMAGAGYDWVAHCAARRDPDACERDPRAAMAVNADATDWVTRASASVGAHLLFASTDYVFPGDDPPYSEQQTPKPINVYGHSKLTGEQRALALGAALVVRMPALYSLDLDAPNNILGQLAESLEQNRTVPADNRHVRYYTLAEEVAGAFQFLIETDYRGLVHVSGPQPSTKLEFLRAAAEALGGGPELVVEIEPQGDAPRPHDSHLDTALYASLGGPEFTGWRDALARL